MRAFFLYFAYGSNLHPLRLARRTPSVAVVAPARLRRHRLAFHKCSNLDASGKCSIQPTGRVGDVVHGVVYRIALAERARLDLAEGLGAGYARIRCRVELPRGHAMVWSYIAEAPWVDDGLLPFDWYLELVLRGAAHHGLPAGWCRRLAATPAVRDPVHRRRQACLAIARGRPVKIPRVRRVRDRRGPLPGRR